MTSSLSQAFPLERLEEITRAPENFRCLERVPFTLPDFVVPAQLSVVDDSTGEFPFVILDVETSGLDSSKDVIIELGLVAGRFSLGGEREVIGSIDAVHSLYQDPGFPIPEEITQLTGITDEMVAGQSIDLDLVASLLRGNTLMIAHNAGFDRPFTENWIKASGHQALQEALKAPWMCTMKDIPWADLGYKNSRSLEVLMLEHGYFYEAHRASVDALATAFLLFTNEAALKALLARGRAKTCQISAAGAPFEVKDALKSRGYSWDGDRKVWGTTVLESDLEEEKAFLSELYSGGGSRAVVTVQSARQRYKG